MMLQGKRTAFVRKKLSLPHFNRTAGHFPMGEVARSVSQSVC